VAGDLPERKPLFTDEDRARLRSVPAPPAKKPKKPKQERIVTAEPDGQGSLPVSVISDQYTDMRLAAIFAETFNGDLLYWSETGKWLVFDGVRWTADSPGSAFPFVRRLIELLYTRAMGCSDYAQRGEMLKAILKLEAHPRQETILAAARTRPELIINASDLDQHPMLLTMPNGTLDLETGTLRAHRPDDYITRLVPIEYNAAAQCPLFLAFLQRIFDGNQDVIDYLQRFAGYCLTGHTGEQVLLFFFGLGCNGKTLLANIFGALLGDLASTANAALLMAQNNRGASNDVAALRGARLVKVSEFDDGERLAESQIKTLTGGDPVTCRFLYQEHFTYTPTYKILLIGNHKPKVRGTDHGIWRRLHLLPFNVTIPEDERDPHLQSKLTTELPGILAWAVRGCLEWQRIGLSPPEEVRAATEDYRKSEDIFDLWLEECCCRGEQCCASAAALLASFVEFSKWKGTTPQRLGRLLGESGFTKEKSNGAIRWRGVGLLSATTVPHWQERSERELL
jgi:putative DNA primase/helicase